MTNIHPSCNSILMEKNTTYNTKLMYAKSRSTRGVKATNAKGGLDALEHSRHPNTHMLSDPNMNTQYPKCTNAISGVSLSSFVIHILPVAQHTYLMQTYHIFMISLYFNEHNNIAQSCQCQCSNRGTHMFLASVSVCVYINGTWSPTPRLFPRSVVLERRKTGARLHSGSFIDGNQM